MGANFRLIVHQNSDNLHLALGGDFDESAAHLLLDTIQKRCSYASQVFIHTNGLGFIDPSGPAVFRSCLGQLDHCRHMRLRFTGDLAKTLAPG
ncbi:MAG: hypothetical protein JXL84_10535 [Deltaproteobacteria bacterium]|nr:hypothetical protein [Deltaproteobacteria bacterium]